MIEFVAGLPEFVKTSAKVLLAAPFAFHGWNGVRHLVWDMGKCTFAFPFLSFFFHSVAMDFFCFLSFLCALDEADLTVTI